MEPTLPNGNRDVRINRIEVLSDAWYTLRRIDFDHRDASGTGYRVGPIERLFELFMTRNQSKLSKSDGGAFAPCIISSEARRYANLQAVSTSSVTWSPRTERSAYMVTSSTAS